jgi:uncharacterized protein (DUF2235 family)
VSSSFGRKNTNVVRLLQCLQRDTDKQFIYYDPGVGTLPEPNRVTRIGKFYSTVAGLAFGAGLTTDVMEGYCFLMEQWEPGDRVFIFGFSRGAYTARVLAGLLHTFGLMPRGAHNLLPYVIKYFRALSNRNNKDLMPELETTYRDFRRTFARGIDGPEDLEHHFAVHFLGLWDTVASVGWVWDPKSFRNTAFNPSVRFARHAIAIDERRVFFRQNRLSSGERKRNGIGAGTFNGLPRLVECWFAGSHCDVGGGHEAADDKLWPISLEWMLQEAAKAQLLVDEKRKGSMLDDRLSKKIWAEEHHESLSGWFWKMAEFFPAIRRRKDYETGEWSARFEIGRGTPRKIRPGELIHKSVLERLREKEVVLPAGRKGLYDPRSLCAKYKEGVRNMQEPLPELEGYAAWNCGCEACERLGAVSLPPDVK